MGSDPPRTAPHGSGSVPTPARDRPLLPGRPEPWVAVSLTRRLDRAVGLPAAYRLVDAALVGLLVAALAACYVTGMPPTGVAAVALASFGVEVGVEVEFDAHRVVVLAVALAERAGSGPKVAVRVDHDEHLLGVVGVRGQSDLARPEELARVLADEQRHVRLLFEVVLVVQPLVDDGLGHAECEGGVRPTLWGQPLVGVDGRLGVVGEDADPLRALVAGVEEVLRVGDARDVDVRPPGDDVVRVVPVGGFGVVRLGAPGDRLSRGEVRVPVVEAVRDAAQQIDEPASAGERHRGHRRNGREPRYRVVPARLHLVDDVVGDLGQRLVPANPLPLTLAALARATERVEHALVGVDVVGVAGPFLTASRIGVGEVVVDGRVVAGLFLSPDLPVLDVDVPRARPGAVDAVGRPGHGVPVPLLAVEIFPLAVGVVADRVVDGLQSRHAVVRDGEARRAEEGGDAESLHEVASADTIRPSVVLTHGR